MVRGCRHREHGARKLCHALVGRDGQQTVCVPEVEGDPLGDVEAFAVKFSQTADGIFVTVSGCLLGDDETLHERLVIGQRVEAVGQGLSQVRLLLGGELRVDAVVVGHGSGTSGLPWSLGGSAPDDQRLGLLLGLVVVERAADSFVVGLMGGVLAVAGDEEAMDAVVFAVVQLVVDDRRRVACFRSFNRVRFSGKTNDLQGIPFPRCASGGPATAVRDRTRASEQEPGILVVHASARSCETRVDEGGLHERGSPSAFALAGNRRNLQVGVHPGACNPPMPTAHRSARALVIADPADRPEDLDRCETCTGSARATSPPRSTTCPRSSLGRRTLA